jgi:hypothetical protein
MLANDPITRVLYIDLNRRRFWIQDRPDLGWWEQKAVPIIVRE